MLKYGLTLAASLMVELLVTMMFVACLDSFLTPHDVVAFTQLFVGPAALIVMGLTVALFDGWRCRIVCDAYLESHGFRINRR